MGGEGDSIKVRGGSHLQISLSFGVLTSSPEF